MKKQNPEVSDVEMRRRLCSGCCDLDVAWKRAVWSLVCRKLPIGSLWGKCGAMCGNDVCL